MHQIEVTTRSSEASTAWSPRPVRASRKTLGAMRPLCCAFFLALASAPALTPQTSSPQLEALVDQLTEHIKKVDPHNFRVPDFAAGKEWFNSPPLSFERQLRGKIVILDFWTYCCINCIHVLPDLAYLERKYAGYPVAFVGVHSAKFENEKVSENIRQAVMRYDIEHPVINDDEMALWRAIGVRSWPTLAVVGPKGNLLLMVSGEGNRDVLDAAIIAALEFYPAEAFRHDPVPHRLERSASANESPLSYPGKLAVDAERQRLYISDSNHHRIVVTDLAGKFITAIGRGRRGLDDGDYAAATFHRLQGLAVHGEHLYVADAENHALRRVDLKAQTVVTLVGDGTQGRDYEGGSSGSTQRLSTPWDVVVADGVVYIAMAGTHQIWSYDIAQNVCRRFSGTGREQNLNHTDRLEAAWAQPSGLTIGDGWLFVADSESSTVRGISIGSGETATFVGGVDSEPRNLFAFGDVDGIGEAARLQHPLGVLWIEKLGRVLVADSYNHRLKLVDHSERRVDTFAGSGVVGSSDGEGANAQFFEPSGFALDPGGDRVFVADTNNHSIRVLDVASRTVSTLELDGVPAAVPQDDPRSRRLATLPGTVRVRAVALRLPPAGVATLRVHLELPANYHYTDGASSRWQVVAADDAPATVQSGAAHGELVKQVETAEVRILAAPQSTAGTLLVEALAYYCQAQGACQLGAVLFEIPIEVTTDVEEREPAAVELRHVFPEKPDALGFFPPARLETPVAPSAPQESEPQD